MAVKQTFIATEVVTVKGSPASPGLFAAKSEYDTERQGLSIERPSWLQRFLNTVRPHRSRSASIFSAFSNKSQESQTLARKAPRSSFINLRERLEQVQDLLWGFSSVYKVLFTIVLLANVLAMALKLQHVDTFRSPPVLICANAAVANLTAAIFIRQPYVINFIFYTTWKIPRSAPLWIRQHMARSYEFGGIHSGAACSSFIWFCLFAAYLVQDAMKTGSPRGMQIAVIALVFLLMLILAIIIFSATPAVRRRHHNFFEQNHRFLGWISLCVFWAVLVLFVHDSVAVENAKNRGANASSTAAGLIRLPIFWLLICLSLWAIWPWLLLRKVRIVKAEHLSNHAIRLYFDPSEKIPPQHGASISKSPLREWHAFAAINDYDNTAGGSSSIIVSRAGDWTAATISAPSAYYYMRGIHVTGAGSNAAIFNRIVFMCTGSGAGPLISALTLLEGVKVRVIWSAPRPREIFGDKICDALRQWDEKALIWDTRKDGRPDLIELAANAYREHEAEAVFFISNRPLTKTVIMALRKRGIPAFAPVFDS